MEMKGNIVMSRLREKLSYLSVITTLAPLLGLLGTIVGMITTFSIFNIQAGQPMAITGGIGEALIATASGLCVAILSLCVHSYLSHKMNNIITNMEQCFSALSETKQPDLNIIPMIDIMFFLLVFFMLSTMYMVEQKTIPVNLPQATSAAIDNKTNFTVTLKDDGSIYLEDQQTDIQTLLMQATKEQKNNPSFAIIIRADKDINYDKVVSFIDTLKKAGITRFGLATNGAGGN